MDCVAATQNLLLASESIGLGSCWFFFAISILSSQDPELRKVLKMSEGYKPYDSAVLGYKKEAVVDVPVRKPNLNTYIR